MDNIQVAHNYARTMAAMTNKCWVSDNLPTLDREERRAILAVYRKYFRTVEYNSKTGVCKCWMVEPYDLSDVDTIARWNSANIETGNIAPDIKQTTIDSITPNATVTDEGMLIM